VDNLGENISFQMQSNTEYLDLQIEFKAAGRPQLNGQGKFHI